MDRGATILAIRWVEAQPVGMTDRPSQHKQTAQQRLSAALRENLRRRKVQAKGRLEERKDQRPDAGEKSGSAAGTPRDHAGGPHDSAGIIEKK
jgi:hypothetical protein